MTTGSAEPGSRWKPPHDLQLPVALGAVIPAIVDVVSANFEDPSLPALTLVLHAIYDVGLFVALGLGVDLAVFGLRSVARRGVAFWTSFALAAGALAYGLLERNFARQGGLALDGQYETVIVSALTLGSGAAVASAWALAAWLGRHRWLWIAGVAAGLAGAIANVVLFRDDYFEAHTAVAIASAIVAGNAARPWVSRRLSSLRGERRRLAVGVACAVAVFTVLLPPANAVRLALFRSPGCAGAWVAALHVWSLPKIATASQPTVPARWLEPRPGAREPSRRLVRGKPVVVLVTVDALRADAINDDARTEDWPTFTKLKNEGVVFTNARSPGSQTSVSLTTTFAGKYFSEMRWDRHGEGKNRFEYAAGDPTPRFPTLLDDAGVSTFKVVSLTFLRNEFGVAPGFAEESVVTEGRKHARAGEVMPPLLARLRKARYESLFAFTHLTEPHAPYDRGKLKKGSEFDRYLSEIAEVDEHLGKLVNVLSAPDMAHRAILIVTADHGEAFGEHGTHQHTKTIYEELVRVPLLVWGAGVRARRVDEPVSLVDLHPTICDLFGVEAPDDVTAESLVPLLAGEDVELERPILAEGRLRRALYADGLKVIADLRRSTIEAYDLAADPGELHNVFEADPKRFGPVLATLEAFYAARGFREGGYEPPYKP